MQMYQLLVRSEIPVSVHLTYKPSVNKLLLCKSNPSSYKLIFYSNTLRVVIKPGMEWNEMEPIGAHADFVVSQFPSLYYLC